MTRRDYPGLDHGDEPDPMTRFSVHLDPHDENGEPGGLAKEQGQVEAATLREAVSEWNTAHSDRVIPWDEVRRAGPLYGSWTTDGFTVYITAEGDEAG